MVISRAKTVTFDLMTKDIVLSLNDLSYKLNRNDVVYLRTATPFLYTIIESGV